MISDLSITFGDQIYMEKSRKIVFVELVPRKLPKGIPSKFLRKDPTDGILSKLYVEFRLYSKQKLKTRQLSTIISID